MSWTTITPFIPFIRLALAVLVALLLYRTVMAIRATARTSSTTSAVRAHQGKVALTAAMALVWIWTMLGASSAFRPKDVIEADYRERERRLEQVDRLEPKADLPEATERTPDWDAAREKFRERTRQEEAQFKGAVSD